MVILVRADQESDRLKKLRRWILELRIIRDAVRSLLLGAEIFWEVQKILAANPRALSHRLFNDWIATNHGIATAVGIRRQLDKDSRSVSLKKLLIEIEATLHTSPELLSRANFLRHFRPELESRADAQFSELVGANTTRVESAYVERDIKRLNEVTEKMERYVNKRIAHRDAQEIERRKLGELDECLGLLEEIVDRYTRLLTGSGSSVTPELPPDWKSVFKVAWASPARRGRRAIGPSTRN